MKSGLDEEQICRGITVAKFGAYLFSKCGNPNGDFQKNCILGSEAQERGLNWGYIFGSCRLTDGIKHIAMVEVS